MNAPWYNTPERIAALDTVADSWIGTPFRENSAVPGLRGGVSCHFLAPNLHFATGAISRFDVPRGSLRKLLNSAADTIVAFIDENLTPPFGLVPHGEPFIPGDIIVMVRETGHQKHIGTVLSEGWFLHVLFAGGVQRARLDDPTYRIAAARRIYDHGQL